MFGRNLISLYQENLRILITLVSVVSHLFTWAVTELSKLDFTVIPSLLINIIPATFLESWILLKVSSNSGVKVIFTAEAGLLTLKFKIKTISQKIWNFYKIFCKIYFFAGFEVIFQMTLYSKVWSILQWREHILQKAQRSA